MVPRVIDEERIRKIAADNPDLLDCRLAQRFGITRAKLRKILGRPGRYGELLGGREMAKAHYTPRPGGYFGNVPAMARMRSKRNETEKKLRKQADAARGKWNPDFKPMRRPNGRSGPEQP